VNPAAAVTNGTDGGRSRVLIVDDNDDKRELLACIVRRHFDVFEARDGFEALARVESTSPDVILLDVLMPGINGFEVCRRLKADPASAEIPVLFVTVLDQDQNRIDGLELGGEDFINWPVNSSELVARINARIRSSRPLNQLRGVVKKQNLVIETDRQDKAATEYELAQARLVQQRFMTTVFPQGRGLTFAHRYRPSRQVGGDLFDIVPVNEHEIALLMADVSGHGMPAALITSVAKVLFRTGVEQCHGPAAMVRWLNRQIAAYLATGEFLTVFVGWWNGKNRLFSYAGAGHPPALLVGPDAGEVERLHVGQGIVGILPDSHFPEQTTELHPGQRLALYTDGITEAMNAQQELFGEERLADTFGRAANLPLQSMVEHVFEAVDGFLAGAPQTDDQALLAMEVTP
jgi:serine phosphatase RsbU (regulator of sigma subunit)